MKTCIYRIFSVLLSALVLGASTGVAFAQKQLKYLPKAFKETKAIPYVVNPKLSPAVRAHFSIPVVRPNVSVNVQRATAAQVLQAPIPTQQVTPATPAVQDTGTNLTGTQVLAHYFPMWRQELRGMFSNEQLDAVEKAFSDTDEWLFIRGEDGELKIRNKDEWDYEARFLTLLQNSGVSFTERQVKQLIGGKRIQGFTFKIYFSRMKATGFSCAKDTKPRKEIWKDGHTISLKERTPEEEQEMIIGQALHRYRNHPLVKAYLGENRRIAEPKTAEEYVALARQYPTKPRSEIWRGGHKLSREEMTPEEIQEVNIGMGLNIHHRNHPLVKAYLEENRLHAKSKTPEEYVALARQYPTKPRARIYRDGRKLSREEMTPEEVQEVNIGMGLETHRKHPLVKAYLEENR